MTDIKDISWPEPMANRLRVANDRIAELEQELAQCLDVHAKLNDENERLRDAQESTGGIMTDQTDIDKRIVEAAKEFVADWPTFYYERNGFMSDKLRKLCDAVGVSNPKAAIRGVMTVNPNPCFEDSYQVPAIEATDEVETRCGPTAGVTKDQLLDLFSKMWGHPYHTTADEIIKLYADAAPAIEEKS